MRLLLGMLGGIEANAFEYLRWTPIVNDWGSHSTCT